MSKEWYILEYENKTYLHNKRLEYKEYPKVEGKHDHCDLCWARFSKHNEDLHDGYFESESKSWICSDCYKKLAKLFGWTL